MLSYHGDPLIKAKYVERMRAHIEADELVRGIGFNSNTNRGCAVGCTLNKYDHAAFETELGIPQWMARLEDTLFERIDLEKSKTFPLLFLEAIPVGVDLELVKAPFLIYVLEKSLTTFDNEKYPNVAKVINDVINLYKSGETNKDLFRQAAYSARAAGYAAGCAAGYAAVYAANAAAYVAYVADAADAADAAARASRIDTCNNFADKLLELLKNAKPALKKENKMNGVDSIVNKMNNKFESLLDSIVNDLQELYKDPQLDLQENLETQCCDKPTKSMYHEIMGKYCIVKNSVGEIFFGILESIDNNYAIKLKDSREIVCLDSETYICCSELAIEGDLPHWITLTKQTPKHYIQQICEITPCNKEAILKLKGK